MSVADDRSSGERPAGGGQRGPGRRRRLTVGGVGAVLVAFSLWGSGYRYVALPAPADAGTDAPGAPSAEESALLRRIAARSPRGTYVVIDRGNNRLYLRRGDEVLLESVVSTGSGAVLRETTGLQRTWTFETPTGHFRILAEKSNPVWTRPDWAFVEEGLDIPERLEDRFQYGALGEYGLPIGDGYMIHGTLYERLLGHSVTHGCVRVGRDDLRQVVARVGPGSSVYIF